MHRDILVHITYYEFKQQQHDYDASFVDTLVLNTKCIDVTTGLMGNL